MDCLIGYIGIKGCGDETTPESGLFINSLPGVNLKVIDKIADHEQKTYSGVWDDVVTRSLQKFSSDVSAAMHLKYRLVDCEECTIESLICDNKAIFKQALWYSHGVELCAEIIHSERLNRFTTIDAKKAQNLRIEFEIEYQRLLNQAIESLDCGDCLECDPIYTIEESIM